MKQTTLLWICMGMLAMAMLLVASGSTAYTDKPAGQSEQEPLGCYQGGKVFEEFFPTAVELRETDFLTPFGTVNMNLVLGSGLSAKASSGAMELAERIGEFLISVNTSAMAEHVSLLDADVPEKYLQEKTMILVGGPEENSLVRRLKEAGTSKVDWAASELGGVEVIPNAFGGPGTAIILAGNSPQGTYNAATALASFFAHLAGATMIEAWMLQADEQLQRGEVEGAARSFERILTGLRIDGASNFHAPIKDWNADFPQLLAAEARQAQDMHKFLRSNPSLEQADEKFRELAQTCVYCHQRYLTYDRMATNRLQYNYSQYPDHRLETEWDRVE
jgi:hypothetical protein